MNGEKDLLSRKRSTTVELQLNTRNKLKNEYIKEFSEYLNITSFIGDYAIELILLAFFIIAIVIIVLVFTYDKLDEYWYITLTIVSLAIFVIVGFIGYKIKKKMKKTTLEVLIDYVFYKLINWTKMKTDKTNKINEKRILLENLMNTFYDYTKFRDMKLWDLELDLFTLYKLIDSPTSHKAILLSLDLFKKVYTDKKGKYSEKGVLIIIKVFLPLLHLSRNAVLCSKILSTLKRFMLDTRMNVFMSKVVNTKNFDPKEKIYVTKKIFKRGNNYLQFFENLWSQDQIKAQVLKEKGVSVNQQVTKSIKQLRVDKRSLNLSNPNFVEQPKSGTTNDSIINSQDLKQSTINNQEIYTVNTRFGLNSVLMERLKSKQNIIKEKEVVKVENEYNELIKQINDDNKESVQTETVRATPKISWNREKLNGFKRDIDNSLDESEIIDEEMEILSIDDGIIKSKENEENILKIESPDSFHESFKVSKNTPRNIINKDRFEVPYFKESTIIEIDPVAQQFLDLAKEPQSNFKLMTNKKGTKVFKRFDEGNPLILVRCDSMVRGDVEKIFDLLFDLGKRERWDTIFCKMKVLKVINDHTDLVYSYIKAPSFITNRDFLQKRISYRNVQGFDIVIAFISMSDDDFPLVKKTIRAHTYISGYALKQENPEYTSIVTLSQSDIKGLIPKAILNRAAAKAPYDWVKKLEKAAANFDSF